MNQVVSFLKAENLENLRRAQEKLHLRRILNVTLGSYKGYN